MLLHFVDQLTSQAAELWPEKTAVIAGQQLINYAALQQQVECCAAGLYRAGVKAHDRVVIALPKQIETVVLLLAVARIGAIAVPVHAQLKTVQLLHIIQDASAILILTNAHRATQLAKTSSKLLNSLQIWDVDLWSQYLMEPLRPTVSVNRLPTDPVVILYTSGSTGLPKGVVLSHQNLLLGAQSVASYLQIQHSDRILALLPFSFDYGLNQLLLGLLKGATVVLHDYLLPQDVVRQVKSQQISVLAAVPPLWSSLSRAKWDATAASSLRLITNSGGSMPQALLAELQTTFSQAQVFLMYGLTEAFRSTYVPPELLAIKSQSIGKAIPLADIRVVRPDGTECAIDEPGELMHRGPLVGLGYWNDPIRTAERFRPDPFAAEQQVIKPMAVWSGDEVRRDKDGYFYYIGRMDQMLKCSGFRISPTEVEHCVYQSQPAISELVALGVPADEVDSAVIIIFSAETAIDATALLQQLKQQLPPYMCPKALIQLAELPKTVNGKLDRSLLAALYKDYLYARN